MVDAGCWVLGGWMDVIDDGDDAGITRSYSTVLLMG
jgi:hypothetical protein